MHIHTSELDELKLGIGNYKCNWGTHICGLYQSEEERDSIIFGYLSEGHKNADKQIFIYSEQTQETFNSNFSRYCPECYNNAISDTVDIKRAEELYYPEGVFDPWYMDKTVNGYFDYTQKDGPANLRAVAEMYWALNKIPGTEYLFAYESRLNYFVKNRPIISLCLYNVNEISGEELLNVLQTHPFTINGGIVTQNPLFIQPERWLRDNAPQFLDEQ